ncbi:hypothetical protein Leryth_012048 [Lithospermum erythrorhizon]|nr:hypothetical protein Leryth_012048 [Lithospermum erythrorhizon]
MRLYDGWFEILKIQKFRRMVSYAGFYSFVALLSYAYTSNTYIKLHWGIVLKRKNGDRLSGVFWLSISKDKENHHMHIMRNTWHILLLRDNWMEVARSRKVPSKMGGYCLSTWKHYMDNINLLRKTYGKHATVYCLVQCELSDLVRD